MKEKYIYVFVRQDQPLALQVVSVAHAVYHMSCLYKVDGGVPNIIVIGVANYREFAKVHTKLQRNQLPSYVWSDPDVVVKDALGHEVGDPTAIATVPLDQKQKAVLSKYRLWQPIYSHEISDQQIIKTYVKQSPAYSGVAQLREQPMSNGKRVGENPTPGAKFDMYPAPCCE